MKTIKIIILIGVIGFCLSCTSDDEIFDEQNNLVTIDEGDQGDDIGNAEDGDEGAKCTTYNAKIKEKTK